MAWRDTWTKLKASPAVQTGLFLIGIVLMLASPIFGALPGLGLLFGGRPVREKPIDRNRIYTITYGSDAPFHFRGPEGSPKGLAVDLVAEAARRAAIKLKWIYSGDSTGNDLSN